MDASLFSWPGLIISLLIAAGILTVVAIVVRSVVRAITRRRVRGSHAPVTPDL